MQRIRKSLKDRRKSEKLVVDKKIITSWNALLISALKEAYVTFGNDTYARLAVDLGNSLIKQHFTNNTLYRVWFDDQASTLATLGDYAYLIRASIDLYDITEDPNWIDRAISLTNIAVDTFHNNNQGFSFSNDGLTDKRIVNVADGELINPIAVMYENIQRLESRTNNKSWKSISEPLKLKLIQQVNGHFLSQFYAAKVLSDETMGKRGAIQYFAKGNGKVQLVRQAKGNYIVQFSIKDNWHINSNDPLDSDFVPTAVSSFGGKGCTALFPNPVIKNVGPLEVKMSILERRFTISLVGQCESIQVTIQACSDSDGVCLFPEEKNFFIGRL